MIFVAEEYVKEVGLHRSFTYAAVLIKEMEIASIVGADYYLRLSSCSSDNLLASNRLLFWQVENQKWMGYKKF